MKKLIIAAALLATCSAVQAADFCRVVTVQDWTVTSAKGVHKESLKDHPVFIYATVNGNLFNQEVNPVDRTKLMSVTFIGHMENIHMITTTDSSNSNAFAFDPSHKSFFEADTFIPDEQQSEEFNLKASAQVIHGTYKPCTLDQMVMMNDNYNAFVKENPWAVQE